MNGMAVESCRWKWHWLWFSTRINQFIILCPIFSRAGTRYCGESRSGEILDRTEGFENGADATSWPIRQSSAFKYRKVIVKLLRPLLSSIWTTRNRKWMLIWNYKKRLPFLFVCLILLWLLKESFSMTSQESIHNIMYCDLKNLLKITCSMKPIMKSSLVLWSFLDWDNTWSYWMNMKHRWRGSLL